MKDFAASGPQPTIMKSNGTVVRLYEESYALLIDESSYLGIDKGGWPKLDNTGVELDTLSETLRTHGFHVKRISNANSAELYSSLRTFISSRAQKPATRVVIVFSGHGHTNSNGFGYLVPVDAPDPDSDPTGFIEKALPIQTLQLLAEEASSPHILFVFDSCFSGSIFQTKGPAVIPDPQALRENSRAAYFLGAGKQPLRQFISAGGAGEKLPPKSSFLPTLVKALEGNLPVSADGYVTSKQLGLWIAENLPGLTKDRTHPQSGVIRDPQLALGDMVFQTRLESHADAVADPRRPLQPSRNDRTLVSVASTCTRENIKIRPGAGIVLEISANQSVCYLANSIEVVIDDIKIRNPKTSTFQLIGAYTKLRSTKDSAKGSNYIEPINESLPWSKTKTIGPGVTLTLPKYSAQYKILEEQKPLLQSPNKVYIEYTVRGRNFTMLDGQLANDVYPSRSEHLMKLWDGTVSY